MGQRQRRRLREAAAASSAPALLRGGEEETDEEKAKRAKAALKESSAPPPPGLREADEPPEAEAAEAAGTPHEECGTCRMFDWGSCWGYGHFPVKEAWLCNSWELAPDWKEQDAMADGPLAFAEAAAAEKVDCPTCGGSGKIRGGGLDCPDCGGTGKVAASKAKESAAVPVAESAPVEERLARIESMLEGLRESKPDYLNRTFDPSSITTNSRGEKGYEITLIREGDGNAEDANFYPGSAIREMCESGRAEGMQAYANHPTLSEEEERPERDVKELIGTHTDVRFLEEAGIPKAKSVFVPITTDEHHPHYGWVTTLAEAAAKNRGPQPLVGWSLFGAAAGEEGRRPDGGEGRIVSLIMPTSGDLVTNAGAGGEFARHLMMESARRLRRGAVPTPTHEEDQEVFLTQYRSQMAEALKKVREADSDEARTVALKEVEALEAEAAKIEVPKAPDSIEALTESAPALVAQIRESAKAEATDDVEKLKAQIASKDERLGEADKLLSKLADVQQIAESLGKAGVEDEKELRHFAGLARQRGLREAADIQVMVEAEREYEKGQSDRILSAVREALGADLPEVGEIFASSRTTAPAEDGGVAFLRESGVPTKAPASA